MNIIILQNNGEGEDGGCEESRVIKPNHKQHLAANSKVLLIADIGQPLP